MPPAPPAPPALPPAPVPAPPLAPVPAPGLPGIVELGGMPTLGAVDGEPDALGLVVEEPPMLLPDEVELGDVMVPLEVLEPELMPEEEPELEPMPVPEVPHAESTRAHAKGMVHFIIKILLENNR